MAQRGRRDISLGVLLLAYQILAVGLDNIPPVTLVAVLAQVAIFLGFIPDLDYHKIGEICVLPKRVWYWKEWKRLVFSSFVHADDMHLYYNMVSFLWKGRRLERKFGSFYFAYLLAIFSLLTNVVLVAVSLLMDDVWKLELSQQCAVGFSGVIFALKVLCNHYFPYEDASLFGWMPIPSQYVCWAELLMIQILVPNASFVGHLAGILVGMAYVHGPLKWIMNLGFNAVSSLPGTQSQEQSRYSSHQNGGYNHSGSSPQDNQYNRYTGGMSEEEQMRRAMYESMDEMARRGGPSAPEFGTHGNRRLYPNVY